MFAVKRKQRKLQNYKKIHKIYKVKKSPNLQKTNNNPVVVAEWV